MRVLFKKAFALIPAALLAFSALAADAPAAAPVAESSSFNIVLLGSLSIIVLFMGAIGLLANVMKQLAFAYRDKMRTERAGNIATKKAVLLLAAFLMPVAKLFAQAADAAKNVVEAAPVAESPFISGIPRFDFYCIMGIIAFEIIVMLVLIFNIRIMVRLLRGIPEKAYVPALIFRKNFLDIFNKSVAIEKEETIVLDHDYDGIRELDNDLPPWWKWGFVLTIVVSIVYMGYYHVYGGPNQLEEYNAAVAKGEEEKTAYLAKAGNKIDENTVTMVLDQGELTNAQTLFKNTCAACHREDAGGNVGPNLTDDYWLHGGSLKDVFKSIKYGWKDKGMPEWQNNMNAKQIAALSSYVKSLKDKKPAGAKAPQGDLFVEGGDKAIDSVSNRTEPSLTPTRIKENKDNTTGPFKNKADGKDAVPQPKTM